MERGEVIVSRGELPDWLGATLSVYGDGSGYGYGDGKQSVVIAGKKIATDNPRPDASAVLFWKSNASGLPANGGKGKSCAAVGLIEEIAGPLSICSSGLHATTDPDKWQGERLWVVALYGEIQWQGDKCAALKREILGEVRSMS